jgi:type IV pilus assembly protein PilC
LDGQLVTDRIAYPDEPSLRQFLRKSNLFVVDLAERKSSRIKYDRKVGLADLVVMCRQLRTMVLVGLPLVRGLEALSQQTVNLRLSRILKEVAQAVTTGRTLASTLMGYPTVFPEILVALVQAGEESGRLPETLQEASRQFELQLEIRQKTLSALMYPTFTLLCTIGTVTVMMLWIVPVFAQIYKDLKAPLPAPTLLLISVSQFLAHNTLLAAVLIAAVVGVIQRYYRTPEGRYTIDDLKLRVPLIGLLLLKAASGALTSSLAGLLESGVPLLQAMRTCARVTGNAVLEKTVNEAALNVGNGRRFSDELERSDRFPPMVVRMIAMAEMTGNLPEVLRYISESYVEEVAYNVRRILMIIEPILVLVVAAVVGFVLICLYYPIFNMGNVFLKGG